MYWMSRFVCLQTMQVMTNGKCKSMWHRVLSKKDANRMSVAAFYNPSINAEVYPAPQLIINKVAEQNGNGNAENGYSYPKFVSKDYMKVYNEQKFLPREPRFEAMRTLYSLNSLKWFLDKMLTPAPKKTLPYSFE